MDESETAQQLTAPLIDYLHLIMGQIRRRAAGQRRDKTFEGTAGAGERIRIVRGVVLFHGALRSVDAMWLVLESTEKNPLFTASWPCPASPRASVNARHVLVSHPCSIRRFNSRLDLRRRRGQPDPRHHLLACNGSGASTTISTMSRYTSSSTPTTRPSRHAGTIPPIPRTASTPLAFSSSSTSASGPTADSSAGTSATTSPVITQLRQIFLSSLQPDGQLRDVRLGFLRLPPSRSPRTRSLSGNQTSAPPPP